MSCQPRGHSTGDGEDPPYDLSHLGPSLPVGTNPQPFQGMHTTDNGSFDPIHFSPGPNNIGFNAPYDYHAPCQSNDADTVHTLYGFGASDDCSSSNIVQHTLSTCYLPLGQQLIGTGQQFHLQNQLRGYRQAQAYLPFYTAQPQPQQRHGSVDPLVAWKQVQEQHPSSAQNVGIFGASVADLHLPWSKIPTVEANSEVAIYDRSSLRPVAPHPHSGSILSNPNRRGRKTCTTCSVDFESAQHFRQHEKSVHGKPMFECACGHLDSDKYNYCRHKHGDDYSVDSGFSWKCGERDSTFADHMKHVTSCEEWKKPPGRPRGTSKWTSILTHRHIADSSAATWGDEMHGSFARLS